MKRIGEIRVEIDRLLDARNEAVSRVKIKWIDAKLEALTWVIRGENNGR